MTNFDHISLHVKDLDESINFFQNLVGLDQIERPKFPIAGAWFALGNNTQLHLIENTTDAIISGSRNFHIAFSILHEEDFLKKCEALNYQIAKKSTRSDNIVQYFVVEPNGWWVEFNTMKK